MLQYMVATTLFGQCNTYDDLRILIAYFRGPSGSPENLL